MINLSFHSPIDTMRSAAPCRFHVLRNFPPSSQESARSAARPSGCPSRQPDGRSMDRWGQGWAPRLHPEYADRGAALEPAGRSLIRSDLHLEAIRKPVFSPRMGAVARSQGREPLDRITLRDAPSAPPQPRASPGVGAGRAGR